ncbi:DNA-binding transcriptional regulator, MarR family [Thiothrix eikelboomii]|uniref:DNA-binding transcriptional regulator, MarR family n=1 Tax=Thiothrix eikelboomii TaxID=92487 RepID=A0A1T4XUY5_9GAMM|nr:MarR family transcriptional regulator [Thiothrix eikelboomii]SKA92851.1 DNA-binding transcriptional regulator, MarR family [Thiothrix eikelboomii]
MNQDESSSKQRLRLWLSLLRTTRSTEAELREFLRVEHDTTLPRFDVMAALYRVPQGLTMTELSRYLLVSNGNVTTVVDRLVLDGIAKREQQANDRRSLRVSLTEQGSAQFTQIASAHEAKVNQLFADFSSEDIEELLQLLKVHAHKETPHEKHGRA